MIEYFGSTRTRAARGLLRPFALLASLLFVSCDGGNRSAPPESLDATSAIPAVVLVQHSVEADGHPLALWEKSPQEPRGVILLLHGRTWSTLPDFDLEVEGEDLSLMDGLVAQGFATYGLDQRGYGATPRDSTGWLTPNRAQRDVAIVLAWIRSRHPGVDPYLFGWSNGSRIAQLTVQRNPELVAGVILFGYPARVDQRFEPSPPVGDPPRTPTTAEAAASDFITEGAISPGALSAYVAAALAADPVRADWTANEEWNALDPAGVTVPTLLLQGEFDPLARLEDQVALFTRLGTADREWVVLAGGDHAALLETPRSRFIQAITAFMTRPLGPA